MEIEDAMAPATDWLEVVVAAAKAAMLKARRPKNCILLVAGVLAASCGFGGRGGSRLVRMIVWSCDV